MLHVSKEIFTGTDEFFERFDSGTRWGEVTWSRVERYGVSGVEVGIKELRKRDIMGFASMKDLWRP